MQLLEKYNGLCITIYTKDVLQLGASAHQQCGVFRAAKAADAIAHPSIRNIIRDHF